LPGQAPESGGGRVLGRKIATAAGATALVLALASSTSLASAAGLHSRATARPDAANLLTALILPAGAATPLYETGRIGTAIPIADGALEAAFTPNGQTAYVIGGNEVTPITISDGVAATARPPVTLPHSKNGADAVAIAITPNGSTALVVNNFAPYWVSWINTSTNKVVAKVKAGVSPIDIAITPNGKYAYVTNAESGTVTPIDIATHAALHPIRVGFTPEAIAITPNGKYAYVANNASGTVTPIRIAGNAALAPIKVGRFPAAIAITPDGKYAYVTNNGSGTVSQISLSARTVVKTIKTASFPDNIVITPNGEAAYVGSFDGQAIKTHLHLVTAINLVTAKTTQIGVGRGPIALGYSALTGLVYVANFYSATVTPITVATNKAGAAIGLAGQHQPEFIAIRPAP
jgi:YVTN family beta-propeller protein